MSNRLFATMMVLVSLTLALAGVQKAHAQAAPARKGVEPPPGKYSCFEMVPRSVNGFWETEYETRGYVILERGGRYTDPYRNPGHYRYDASTSVTHFSGGLLNGATAEHIETKETPHRYRVVIPTSNGTGRFKNRRWLCNRVRS